MPLRVSIVLLLLGAASPLRADPSFDARVARHTKRLARQMAGADTRRQHRYDLGDARLAAAVVGRLLEHPTLAYGGGFRRASMNGRGQKAIFRTSCRSADKLQLLRRLSWRNHSVDLWADGRGGIYWGGTNTGGAEMGILKRGKRYTYLIGDSNSVGGPAMEARHGRLLLHTHPAGTSRAISAQDIKVFGKAAGGATSRRLELGKNVQLIASYPGKNKDRPGTWFRDVDIYVWASDLPKDFALLPTHPLYGRVMNKVTTNGFRGFERPRGIIVNPTRSESVVF